MNPFAPVSVLMTIHAGVPPQQLAACLASLAAQTRMPAEIVLVLDGFVPEEIEQEIEKFSNNTSATVVLEKIAENVGQGTAANRGMALCRQPWIARMDSDDICDVKRFALQMAVVEENPAIDVVCSWQGDFTENPQHLESLKKVPEQHQDIVQKLRWRNIVPHASMMVRAEKMREIGGYKPLRILEDYDLCMRLVEHGAVFQAVQAPLYLMRVSLAQRRRRSGLGYVRQEWKIRYSFYKAGHFGFGLFLLSSMVYTAFRLQPAWSKEISYRLVREKQPRFTANIPDVPAS